MFQVETTESNDLFLVFIPKSTEMNNTNKTNFTRDGMEFITSTLFLLVTEVKRLNKTINHNNNEISAKIRKL